MKEIVVRRCMSVLALCLATVLTYFAVGLLVERQELVAREKTQQIMLVSVRRFANEHSNYERYSFAQKKKLQQLEKQIMQKNSAHKSIAYLQNFAEKQNIKLADVQILTDKQTKTIEKMQIQRVKINALGDFFYILRWLRQLERETWKVYELKLCSEQDNSNLLHIELVLELTRVNL